MLFSSKSYLKLAAFAIIFTSAFVSGCTKNLSSPLQGRGIEEIKFVSNGSISVSDALWDPTGKKIVINNYAVPTSKIYLLDLDNGEAFLLYANNGSAGATDWTPDGRFITAFIDTKDGDGIWNLDPNNNKPPEFITTGHEAAWSPDGTRLAVLDHSPWIPSSEYTEKLRIIDVQNRNEETPFEIKASVILATSLSWSKNGKYIAFSLSTDHGSEQIYILDVNTNIVSKITDDENDHWSPSWSPDSQFISYVKRSPKTFENSIVISTIDGKCKVSVPGITDVWSVTWSPNGKQLLFNWRNSNIYVADLEVVLGRDILTEGIDCP